MQLKQTMMKLTLTLTPANAFHGLQMQAPTEKPTAPCRQCGSHRNIVIKENNKMKVSKENKGKVKKCIVEYCNYYTM